MKKALLSILTAALFISGSTTLLNAKQGKQNAKPFLIQGKLPHLTMMVKILWNDEDLALTTTQKEKLLVIRKHTMSTAKSLGREILKLETLVVKKSNEGVIPDSLKETLNKIAELRVEASMVHLECIYNTRAILSKDQLYILE
ncbi:hypothetical protein [Sulfurimonas sp.]|jgi:hypothetical protein|uniref:hypothetical protein n=1 Tax=Sulfurimonas sp. TaxID=2022749 RepID=UPI0025FDB318|nr:hypothetical protein [Sulfurimonas sp.]MBT5935658.1 hypothetical protein [Sulfurimonas sp.]